MATMYSLFLGFLLTVVCGDNGNGSSVLDVFKSSVVNGFYTLYQGRDFHFFLDEKTKQKNQGLVAQPKFNLCSLKIKNSLRSNSLIFLTRSLFKFLTVSQPRPFYLAGASSSLQFGSMSPLKLLTLAEGCTTVQSKGSSDKAWTLGRYQVSRPSGMEDKRSLIVVIASKELGVREVTGNNDGPRIEEYLRYTNLGPHHEWCAAFISWCYGQAGFSVPRNPWSPALLPKARQISKDQCRSADVFGIYGSAVKRINHVGLVKEKQGKYIVTIEGNSNNRVESRRRHLKTVYAIADWVE